ncbi:MAG TPA: hypothetical protein VFX98_19325 [Longimicrobiaceae bacterium]|nr:hypothetical protein [Longimicrobiaceae bacterium]
MRTLTLLAILFAVRTLGYVLALAFTRPEGPENYFYRALLVGTLVLSGVVVMGLFRRERWVVAAMEAWIALWVVRTAARRAWFDGWDVLAEPATWALMVPAVCLMYLPVLYVRGVVPRPAGTGVSLVQA